MGWLSNPEAENAISSLHQKSRSTIVYADGSREVAD